MATRAEDWLRQAKRDLEHARHALEDEDYEWSCFAAQQAAEKAAKALYQKLGADAWGHSVSALLSNLPTHIYPEDALVDKAKELDMHYIPSRYPNSYPSGAPLDFYTREGAERVIGYAEEIITFCEDKIFR
ncbi:MAG: HEPN domain-containing protein [Methanomicrobia archaeon]|nr:HEPN domain-containing protein [Methanomicrobia archaeon]